MIRESFNIIRNIIKKNNKIIIIILLMIHQPKIHTWILIITLICFKASIFLSQTLTLDKAGIFSICRFLTFKSIIQGLLITKPPRIPRINSALLLIGSKKVVVKSSECTPNATKQPKQCQKLNTAKFKIHLKSLYIRSAFWYIILSYSQCMTYIIKGGIMRGFLILF